MANEQLQAGISVRPYYGPETPIEGLDTPQPQRLISFDLVPTSEAAETPTTPEEIPGLDYFQTEQTSLDDVPVIVPTAYRAVIINIESTGIDPLTDRLICVGLKDPSDTSEEFELFANKDERIVLKELMQFISTQGYTHFVGWNISFDMHFILYKCMKYALPAREFFSLDWIDLMDIMRKGREKYSYTANKFKRLNDVAFDILGREAPMEDEEALKIVATGDDTPMHIIDGYHVIVNALLFRLYINTTENSYLSAASEFIPGVGEKNLVKEEVQCSSCRAGLSRRCLESG